MAMKKILKENGQQILPITRLDCVVDLEGKLMNEVIAQMKLDIQGQGSALDKYVLASDFQKEQARVNKKIADDIAAESALRVAAEGALQEAINDEIDRAGKAEKDLSDRIKTFEGEGEGSVKAQISAAKTELEGQIQAAEAAAKADAKKAQDDVDALETVVGSETGGLIKKVNDAIADHATLRQEFAAEDLKINQAINAINDEQAGILAQAKAYADIEDGKIEKDLTDELAAVRSEFAAADGTLKTELQAEIDADVKVEKERAEGKEAELLAKINKEIGDRETAVGGVQSALDDAVAALEGEDATLAKAIEDEETRALAAEGLLAGRIDDLEAMVDGDVSDAIEGAVNAAVGELNKKDEELAQGIAGANAAAEAAQEAADKAQEEVDAVEEEIAKMKNADEEGSLANLIADEAARAAQEEGLIRQELANEKAALQENIDKKVDQTAYNNKVKALEDEDARIVGLVNAEAQAARAAEQGLADRLEIIEGADTVEGSIAKAEKDAKAYADELIAGVNTEAGNLTNRVKANEDKLAIVQGPATQEGSIAKALADANQFAKDEVAKLVGEAPEALDTVYELAKAIQDHDTEFDAYVATVAADIKKAKEDAVAAAIADAAAKDAALKADLQAEIDTDVKAEADRAKGEEQRIEAAYKAAVATEKTRAEGVEAGLQSAIDTINHTETGILAQAKAYAKGLDDAMDGRMDDVEAFVQGHSHATMEGNIASNAAALTLLNGDATKKGSVAYAVKQEADARGLAVTGLQDQIDELCIQAEEVGADFDYSTLL